MDHQAPTIEEDVAGRAAEPLDFGVWTDHCVPQDRSGWQKRRQRQSSSQCCSPLASSQG